MDIVHSPFAVFARRRASGFWAPLLMIAIVASILAFSTSRILEPAMDADSQRSARAIQQDNPGMDVTAGERMMESAGTFFALAGGVFLAVAVLVQGFFIWVGAKLAGSKLGGRSAVLIATYAAIPGLIAGLAAIIEGMARGPASLDSLARLSWSPARFMNPDANWRLVQFIATALDVSTIWWAVLAAIGLSVIGNMSRQRAAGVIAALWVVTSLPNLVGMLIR